MYGSDAQFQEPSEGAGGQDASGMPEQQEAQQQPQQDIIPESIIEARRSAQSQAPRRNMQRLIMIIGIIVVVAVVAGFTALNRTATPTAQTSSSTIIQSNLAQISGCGSISKPGRYYLSGTIKTGISTGSCINITSNNVALVCNQDRIIGSGPFVGTPPFTYGVAVNGRSNVSISSCPIMNFSYGIYSLGSANLSVTNDNVSLNYVSDIYLNGTTDSKVSNNYLSKASGTHGAIFLTNGSIGNRITNNTVQYNRFVGIGVNSSFNQYIDNFVNGTPISFSCSVQNGYPASSTASGNICYNNTGCGFLSCRSNNIPANLSTLKLSGTISSCGSITRPGTYSMSGSISMAAYSNITNPQNLRYNVTCISIRASNVQLNCMNHSITNATFAVSTIGRSNVTLNNCRIGRSNTALLVRSSTQVKVFNSILQNNTYGLILNGSNINFINNLSAYNNRYGIYLHNASSDTFTRFNASFNGYGLYLNASLGDVFNSGTAVNNSISDVYATADSSKGSYSIMQGTTCGSTNAAWATCRLHIQSSSGFTPIYSCQPIDRPGVYELNGTIVNGTPNCLNIESSNVTLNCLGYTVVSASTFTQGAAIYLNGENNVTIENCETIGFSGGVNASNGSKIIMQSLNVSAPVYGYMLNKLRNSFLIQSVAIGTSNESFDIKGVTGSGIEDDMVAHGSGQNVGYLFNNSRNNNIVGDSDSHDYIGMQFVGQSTNNTVQSNIMDTSVLYDYECSAANNGVNFENGGINTGVTKNGCKWLAAIPTVVTAPLQCQAAFQPSYLNMVSDAQYPFNNRCFTVYGNFTTINCEGHTVISTSGGTFAYFSNATGGIIENCVLKGFNNPIVSTGSGISIINDTISDQNATTTAIAVSYSSGGTYGATISDNNVTAIYGGISISNSSAATLKNNVVYGASTAYSLSNVTSSTVTGNLAGSSTAIGISSLKSSSDIFSNNNFTSSYIGMECMSGSTSKSSNLDNGGNVCSSVSSCAWVSKSSVSCP